MGTFRTWAALGAALVVTLAFGPSPAGAQSQSTEVGAPLSLTPPAAKARKAARAKRIARAIRKAKRSFAYVRPAQQQPTHVIGGAQSVALVTQLPWWQSSESTRQRYQVAAVASPVLTAADAFVDAKAAAGQAYTTARLSQMVEDDDAVAPDTTVGTAVSSTTVSSVVDAGEFNALDRTAPPDKPWLTGLMVMLAGALAAIGAARFLFAR